ncbi:MAG: RnfABCDGE type electron transport complex subunit G [Firmicutes bacterium]|nr:RnfABCDGE type electron transport complex subunit G [Bacillota bacterium]
MHENLKLIVVLGLIATISGGVLAYVHQTVSPIIEANKLGPLRDAIYEVLPGATAFEVNTLDSSSGEGPTIYQGTDDSQEPVGIAFVAVGSGFGGPVEVMVGLDTAARTIVGIKVLDHQETPGLGSRIADPPFTGQFADKSIDDDFIVDKDVDMITGATISCEAVASAIKNTVRQIEPVLRAGGAW